MDTVKRDYLLAAQALAELITILVGTGTISRDAVQPQLSAYKDARDKWLDTI